MQQIQTKLLYLLPLRLFVGLSFILAGENKIGRGDFGAGYADSVTSYVQANLPNSYGFYQPFLENVVLPNAGTFAILVAWNELLFGTLLFLGMFTRIGAAFGMLQTVNLTFTTGRGLWLPGMDAAYFYAILTLMLTNAGRTLGVDQLVHRRWPKWPFS